MSASLKLALACVSVAYLVCCVTSTPLGPVKPVLALSQMFPDHACLFTCSTCFPEAEDTELLLYCSNKVCGPVMEGRCAMEKFIWLGHHCRDYGMVEKMWKP